MIVKPKTEQESENIKKVVKEKVDIKNLAVGITKIKKRGKGSIILGCESEREIKLKETARKMGNEFDITEAKNRNPKIKIINVSEEEMKLKDEKLIDMILKQKLMRKRKDST